MFKQLHPNIQARLIISFFSKIIGSSLLPFMAIYFTNEINATVAGILLIINTIIQFTASIFGGYLVDNIGRRKLMVIGEWTKVIALLGMALSNSDFFSSTWITFIMLLLMSLAQRIILPASEAMLIDVSKPETRAYMYSLNYWGSNLSMMLGVILGGWFFQQYMFNLILFLVVLAILTAIFTTITIAETLSINTKLVKGKINYKDGLNNYRHVVKDYPFILFTLGGIMLMSIEFQRDNYISVRLDKEFSAILSINNMSITIDGIKMLSILTVVNMLFIVLFTPLISKYININRNREKKMYIGFLLFTIGYAICTLSNNIIILLVATLVFSIGELINVPIRQSILSEIIDNNKRASYMAFNGLVIQVGKLIASSCLLISPYISKYVISFLVLTFGFVSILFIFLSIRSKNKDTEYRNAN